VHGVHDRLVAAMEKFRKSGRSVMKKKKLRRFSSLECSVRSIQGLSFEQQRGGRLLRLWHSSPRCTARAMISVMSTGPPARRVSRSREARLRWIQRSRSGQGGRCAERSVCPALVDGHVAAVSRAAVSSTSTGMDGEMIPASGRAPVVWAEWNWIPRSAGAPGMLEVRAQASYTMAPSTALRMART